MAKTTHSVDASLPVALAAPRDRASTETGLRELLTNLFLPVVVHDGRLIIEATPSVQHARKAQEGAEGIPIGGPITRPAGFSLDEKC